MAVAKGGGPAAPGGPWPINADEVERRFRYYPPDQHRAELHQLARDEFRDVAHRLAEILPECREKSLALTALEEGLMWANAAIARNVPDREAS